MLTKVTPLGGKKLLIYGPEFTNQTHTYNFEMSYMGKA